MPPMMDDGFLPSSYHAPPSKEPSPSSIPYKHSTPAPMDTSTKAKYLSRFQPRVSNYETVSHDACIESHVDLFGGDGVGKVIGGMNAYVGDFTALCAPEALPERMGVCSYFIEYAFVHDDECIDAIHTAQLEVEKNAIVEKALGPNGIDGLKGLDESDLKRKNARAKIWSVLTEIDSDYARRSQTKWREWFETGHGMRDKEFKTLEEYLATRALDCGANWVVRLMGWASGVELTPEEEELTGPITYLAFVVLGITNDIWSWEKEKKVTAESGGTHPLINAVQIVMQLYPSSDEETAKKVVYEIIRKHENQYCRLRDEYLLHNQPSPAIRKWFQVLELSIAGNALWSIGAIRYHPAARNPYHCSLPASSVFEHLEVGQSRGREIDETGSSHAAFKTLDGLDESVLWKPYDYISSMPSKGFRQHLIEALQLWYNIPQNSMVVISVLGSMLHEASLMLDDIQDGSALRRGQPATHEIFGIGQTINSACFQINNAFRLVQQLSPSACSILTDELSNLYIGQGHDIAWTSHKIVPTEEDYLRMVDGKTGGLFSLLYRLMKNEATQNQDLDLSHFMTQMGRYYQIRDDYQNLICQDYMNQRGFCQDLDEGKLSFPFTHAYQKLGHNDTVLTDLLHMRDRRGGLSHEAKQCIVSRIEDSGSLDYTQDLLDKILEDLSDRLGDVESVTGQKNWILQSMMVQLKIKREKKTIKKENRLANVLRVWGGYQRAAWRT